MTWRPSDYSAKDLAQMQHDAERRVRDMQELAQKSLESSNSQGARSERSVNLPSIPIPDFMKPKSSEEPKKERAGILSTLGTVFDSIGVEQDHFILLMIIFLLLQSEEKDKTLLLALGYLLL